MNRPVTVAVVGATGAVGETMLSILEQRDFPVGELIALASARSAGSTVRFKGRDIVVRDLATFDPKGVDIALFSAGGDISKEYAPKFAAAGAIVIDNSSAFRQDADVPLVVSEVNPDALASIPRGIVANPNCSTMQMLVALAPIHRAVGIERINVCTYQSVSGGGRSAMEELGRQTAALLNGQDPDPQRFPVQIAFNLIPHIDDFLDNGYTREEMKIVWESRKILDLPSLAVSATAVRVPVRVGHGAAVRAEFDRVIAPDEARAHWRPFPGLEVVDEPERGRYPTPLLAEGRDAVLVGRARNDLSDPKALEFFVASDNLRKGAALNAVQIAEALLAREAATRS